MASTYDGTTRSARLTAVDALRGLVMVVMALDHTRDFVHAGAMAFAPEDLTRTTPILFLTMQSASQSTCCLRWRSRRALSV